MLCYPTSSRDCSTSSSSPSIVVIVSTVAEGCGLRNHAILFTVVDVDPIHTVVASIVIFGCNSASLVAESTGGRGARSSRQLASSRSAAGWSRKRSLARIDRINDKDSDGDGDDDFMTRQMAKTATAMAKTATAMAMATMQSQRQIKLLPSALRQKAEGSDSRKHDGVVDIGINDCSAGDGDSDGGRRDDGICDNDLWLRRRPHVHLQS